MSRLKFLGAQVLRGGGLQIGDLGIDGGVIGQAIGRDVDLTGYLILPGIVDVHGDGFERHLAPRRGALPDLSSGLIALEGELAANGITTAWLAQFWSWEGGMRAPTFAPAVSDALRRHCARADLRMQLRFETHLVDDLDAVCAFIAGAGIDYVVFNDSLPHDALRAGKQPARLTGAALRSGRSPSEHLEIMRAAHANGPKVADALKQMIAGCPGVTFGSHDDDKTTRVFYADLGVGIAEFPLEREAARGCVVMGAPNVVRGRSQHRNLSAREVLGDRTCQVLASDYHYPSLAQAAFALVREGWSLANAWELISAAPARMMGLDDRGTLEIGQRADLVVVEAATLEIHGTMAAGCWTMLRDPLASRLLG